MRFRWRDKPIPLPAASCKELAAMRQKKASVEDAANPQFHIARLKALNARLAEFWRRK